MRAPRSFKTIFALAAGIIAMGAVGTVAYETQAPQTVRVTVTDKDRQVTPDGDGGFDSKYMVFTDKEVFENRDNLLRWKFNSSDIQGRLERGKQYDLKVYGYRNHFFSSYRNILDATPVAPAAPAPR